MIDVKKVLERLLWWRKPEEVECEEEVDNYIQKHFASASETAEQKCSRLQAELEYAQRKMYKLHEDKVCLTRRLTGIKDLFVDLEKIFYSSNFTRSQLASMSPEEFAISEAEIDKEIEEGRTFLP